VLLCNTVPKGEGRQSAFSVAVQHDADRRKWHAEPVVTILSRF